MSKISHKEWGSQNQRVVKTAAERREYSQSLRADTARLAKVTLDDLQRTQREVQNTLSLRIDDIDSARRELERVIDQTYNEIGQLSNHKDMAERELKNRDLPLEINTECQELRDMRIGTDMVEDYVDDALEQEAELLREIQAVLTKTITDAAEQLRLLRAAKFRLEEDLKDKFGALDIDRTCADLDETSRHVDLHATATRVESKAVHPEDWNGYTMSNIERALREIQTSQALREEIDDSVKTLSDRQETQANNVENSLNSRIAEYKDTLQDAKTNLAKTQQEIFALEGTIKDLEDTIESRTAPMKVAQTRLERRKGRPNVELVRDDPEHQLLRQVGEIEAAVEQLRERLDDAEEELRGLIRAELDLKENIDIKTNSLNLENKCMQRRLQYKYRSV